MLGCVGSLADGHSRQHPCCQHTIHSMTSDFGLLIEFCMFMRKIKPEQERSLHAVSPDSVIQFVRATASNCSEEHMLKTPREWMTRFQSADSQWLFRASWHSSMSSTHECDSITAASSTYSGSAESSSIHSPCSATSSGCTHLNTCLHYLRSVFIASCHICAS